MTFDLAKMNPAALMKQAAISDVLKMNAFSANFGLVLTPSQAEDLVETRFLALKDHGRIELGKGIAEKLIEEFCDSQYLNTDNYAEHLNELMEIFYYLKAESREIHGADGLISDNEIIAEMKQAFETICQGSIELLAGREGMKIARAFSRAYKPDFDEDHNHEGGYEDDWADEWETGET